MSETWVAEVSVWAGVFGSKESIWRENMSVCLSTFPCLTLAVRGSLEKSSDLIRHVVALLGCSEIFY